MTGLSTNRMKFSRTSRAGADRAQGRSSWAAAARSSLPFLGAFRATSETRRCQLRSRRNGNTARGTPARDNRYIFSGGKLALGTNEGTEDGMGIDPSEHPAQPEQPEDGFAE